MAANYNNIRNLSRRGKGSKPKASKPQRERPQYEYKIKVLRVLDGKYGILFDVMLNNVTVYGCRLCETKAGVPFVGFPQQRDKKDPDKWWSIAYAPLTEDQTGEICKQISEYLEREDQDDTGVPEDDE